MRKAASLSGCRASVLIVVALLFGLLTRSVEAAARQRKTLVVPQSPRQLMGMMSKGMGSKKGGSKTGGTNPIPNDSEEGEEEEDSDPPATPDNETGEDDGNDPGESDTEYVVGDGGDLSPGTTSYSDPPSMIPSDSPSTLPSDYPSVMPSDVPSILPTLTVDPVEPDGVVPDTITEPEEDPAEFSFPVFESCDAESASSVLTVESVPDDEDELIEYAYQLQLSAENNLSIGTVIHKIETILFEIVHDDLCAQDEETESETDTTSVRHLLEQSSWEGISLSAFPPDVPSGMDCSATTTITANEIEPTTFCLEIRGRGTLRFSDTNKPENAEEITCLVKTMIYRVLGAGEIFDIPGVGSISHAAILDCDNDGEPDDLTPIKVSSNDDDDGISTLAASVLTIGAGAVVFAGALLFARKRFRRSPVDDTTFTLYEGADPPSMAVVSRVEEEEDDDALQRSETTDDARADPFVSKTDFLLDVSSSQSAPSAASSSFLLEPDQFALACEWEVPLGAEPRRDDDGSDECMF